MLVAHIAVDRRARPADDFVRAHARAGSGRGRHVRVHRHACALYVNDLTVPPMTQRLVPGERRTYVFSGIVEDIRMLRLDPTDVTPATVDLHSIVVVGDRGILAQFGPTALAGWGTDALATKGADETGLHLQTTTHIQSSRPGRRFPSTADRPA